MKALQKIKALKETQEKLSGVFNSKAFQIAGVVKESVFCSAFIAAGVVGVVSPLAAAMITTSHAAALGKNIKKLCTAPSRRSGFFPAFSC